MVRSRPRCGEWSRSRHRDGSRSRYGDGSRSRYGNGTGSRNWDNWGWDRCRRGRHWNGRDWGRDRGRDWNRCRHGSRRSLLEIRVKATNLELSGTLGLGRIEDDVTEAAPDVEESGAVDDDLAVAALIVRNATVAGIEVVGARLVHGVNDRLGRHAVVGLLLDLRSWLH